MRRSGFFVSLLLAATHAAASSRAESAGPSISLPVRSVREQKPVVRITAAVRDKDGFQVHEVESPHQKGKTHILVLTPDIMEDGKKYPVVYVLPVEQGMNTQFGHGLIEIKKLGLHNKLGIIFVMPTFSDVPWYCDHPTKSTLRQESYLLEVVLPFIEKTYPVVPGSAGRWLLGFSKSGWGAFALLLRHPDVFGRAAVWDAPLNLAAPKQFGTGPIFGTQENFEKYQISVLLKKADKLKIANRLGLVGRDAFRPHHQAIHEQMTRLEIPHEYRDVRQGDHRWGSGWIEDAVRFLIAGRAGQ